MGKITLNSNVKSDKYTEYIQEVFDFSVADTSTVEIPFNLPLDSLGAWNIGVICGASGSGKTQILNRLGGCVSAEFDNTKSVISNFDNLSPANAAELLCAMGLSSVPTWVRPYNTLSNGEQYRAQLAWIIAHSKSDEIIKMDEYTSVVDRNVAKSMSYALQKYIKRENKRIILATCHYDIMEWLQPDWVYDLNKGGVLERGDYLRQGRPSIPIRICRTEPDTWRIFAKHHYITADMNKGAASYCFSWDDKTVGFCGVLANPYNGSVNTWRISRLVVLPDFQGVGIGRHIAEIIGGIYKSIGGKIYIKTVNPRLGEYFTRSPIWTPTAFNGKQRTIDQTDKAKYANRMPRKSYCFKYDGAPLYGYEYLTRPIDVMREERRWEGQLTLFD